MIKRTPFLVFVEVVDTEDEADIREELQYLLDKEYDVREAQVFRTNASTDNIKEEG